MVNTTYTLSMALTDYIPVIIFGVCGVLLMKDLYNKMPKGVFACLDGGVCITFLAGFLKATYKLLNALGVGDFVILNKAFLPLQSPGLLLTGLSIILMLAMKKKKAALMAPLTLGLISMMVIGLGSMCAGLAVVAKKMKKGWLIPIFILCFVCYMGMGYLASRGGDTARDNWIEQGVNCVGQILLLVGVGGLHRAGLRDFEL